MKTRILILALSMLVAPAVAQEMSQAERLTVVAHLASNMVPVEGGTFTMGATSEQGNDAYAGEKPKHGVTLSSYYIGRFEVTQREWEAVMGTNPASGNFEGDNRPVLNVSWDDCQVFIEKLNKLTGRTFRLPTEAEWEYAARGGKLSQGYKYAGSNIVGDVAWFRDNSGFSTHNVGTKQPNELGLYDMNGNVSEWCQDWYNNYDPKEQTDPRGPSTGSGRVFRGGDWSLINRLVRVSYRENMTPSNNTPGLGFRLAL